MEYVMDDVVSGSNADTVAIIYPRRTSSKILSFENVSSNWGGLSFTSKTAMTTYGKNL